MKKNVGKVDRYVPFKVKAKASVRDKLFNSDIWPCKILVMRFRKPIQRSEMFRETDRH